MPLHHTEPTAFDDLLKQHGLGTDPALLFLSEFVNSTHLQDLLASTAPAVLRLAVLAGSDLGAGGKQRTFALLDTLYEWLREATCRAHETRGNSDR